MQMGDFFMVCPKCYGSIDKRTKRCKSCGFNLNSVEGALHKDVKRARREGFGADVVYTNILPADISRKKLLNLCIFLGLVGGHSYYAGKFIKAIYSTISFVFALTFAIISIFFLETYSQMGIVGVWCSSVSYLLMGINLIMFIFDLVKIITKKYKVSVYKDSFSI